MSICKCDVCGQFAEENILEATAITIKKHITCDINGAFGKQTTLAYQEVKTPLDLPRVELPPAQLLPNNPAPYLAEELNKMKID